MRLLESGDPAGEVLLFVHGNLSSADYFASFMLSMPPRFRCLAVDLRGYGGSEDIPIDATRGARDWADDLQALLGELGIPRAHLIGWSMGGAAVLQFALDYVERVCSVCLLAPVSPYGFGGTRDVTGTPCYADYAGSGGGLVNPEFVQRLEAGDLSTASDQSPRMVIRSLFVRPPFQLPEEDKLVKASLRQKLGEDRYPGDAQSSQNWPYLSPGRWGPLNAMSGRYLDLSGLIELKPKPPVLWIRGEEDRVISDNSESDPAVLGARGVLPQWPGYTVYPPQPMVAQTRTFLNKYRENGGVYREMVLPDTGHSPFLERPTEVRAELLQSILGWTQSEGRGNGG